MGIQDRDYMRRPPKDDDRRRRARDDSNRQDRAPDEGIITSFLRKHPRFLMFVGIGLGALMLIAIIMAKISGHRH